MYKISSLTNIVYLIIYSTLKGILIFLNVHYFLRMHTPADEHLLIALYIVRSSHIKNQGAMLVSNCQKIKNNKCAVSEIMHSNCAYV